MEEIFRSPTKKMIKQLELAQAKELSKKENQIITLNDFKGTFAGLYKRGIVNTRRIIHEGKSIESVYITFLGVRYLEWLDQKLTKKSTNINLS